MVLIAPPEPAAAQANEHWIREPTDARRAVFQPAVILSGFRKLRIDPAIGSSGIEWRWRIWQAVCGCQIAAWAFLAVLGLSAWQAWPFVGFSVWPTVGALGRGLLLAITAKFAVIAAARLTLIAELLWFSLRHKGEPVCDARGLS